MPKRQVARRAVSSAPPRSLYRKIQSVLDEARRGQSGSREGLIDSIESRGYVDFTRYRVKADRTVDVVPCSKEAIARAVDTCVSLGLLDGSTGKPTREGAKASDPSEFEGVMRHALTSGFVVLGAPLSNIRKATADLLTKYDHETLPTWDAIYDRLGVSGGGPHKETFRSYLTLLSLCHGISFSRKKIYLPE